MKRWRITFTNGDVEDTPIEVDKLTRTVSGDLLMAQQTMTYGPDKVVASYPIANIRKWEPVE